VATDRFDRQYFERWYRDEGFGSPSRLRRKVDYALAATEYLLERPVRSVLDVGCGEGEWARQLRRRRPNARYLGVDPSEYVVGRFGRSRHLVLGGLGDLGRLDLQGPHDLVVCSDVIAYVPAAELQHGLRTIEAALVGAAFIEVFTAGDDFEGDLDGYLRRSPATYERWFAAAGLQRVGPHLYAGTRLLPQLAAFERR
jgi:SAM-dependent methyltransferase